MNILQDIANYILLDAIKKDAAACSESRELFFLMLNNLKLLKKWIKDRNCNYQHSITILREIATLIDKLKLKNELIFFNNQLIIILLDKSKEIIERIDSPDKSVLNSIEFISVSLLLNWGIESFGRDSDETEQVIAVQNFYIKNIFVRLWDLIIVYGSKASFFLGF